MSPPTEWPSPEPEHQPAPRLPWAFAAVGVLAATICLVLLLQSRGDLSDSQAQAEGVESSLAAARDDLDDANQEIDDLEVSARVERAHFAALEAQVAVEQAASAALQDRLAEAQVEADRSRLEIAILLEEQRGLVGAGERSGADPSSGALGIVRVPAGQEIQIRSLNAISGEVAFLGVPVDDTIRQVVKAFGAIKGFDVNVGATYDDLCSADGGFRAAQTIVAEPDVVGVVGTTCTAAAVTAAPIISDAGLTMVSPTNTGPSLTNQAERSDGYYRTSHNDNGQAVAAANFAFNWLGHQTAAAIGDDNQYSIGLVDVFADEFERLGGSIVAVEHLPAAGAPGEALDRIGDAEPGIVYFPSFQPLGDEVVRQFRSRPAFDQVDLLASDGVFTESFTSRRDVAGVYLTLPDYRFDGNVNESTGIEHSQALEVLIASGSDEPALPFWAHGYDATTLLLEAIDAASTRGAGELIIDLDAIRLYLDAVDGYQGLTGTLSCGSNGDCSPQAMKVIELGGAELPGQAEQNVVFEFSPN